MNRKRLLILLAAAAVLTATALYCRLVSTATHGLARPPEPWEARNIRVGLEDRRPHRQGFWSAKGDFRPARGKF